MQNRKYILINTTVLVSGGGVQVAVSTLYELRKNKDYFFVVLLSNEVSSEINKNDFPESFSFYKINSPAAIKTRKKVIRQLDDIEKKYNPIAVFSIFGPSYWRPKAIHLMGFALPWLVYVEFPIFKIIGFKERLKQILIRKYKWHYINKSANYIVTETEDVKQRLNRIYNFPIEKIFVVGNTCNSVFTKYKQKKLVSNKKFKLITISANYQHKNLKIIKKLIPILNGKIDFEFILTIKDYDYQLLFNDFEKKYVRNLGPISINQCPVEYAKSDVLFLPTLLECFSANYPEAMSMHKPILTSNYSFARDVCKDAAEYFDPLDPIDISNKILFVYNNKERYNELIKLGIKRLKDFPSAEKRANLYISIIEKIIK